MLDCRIPSEPSETPLINRTDPWSREGLVQVRREVMVWMAAGVHEAPCGGEEASWGELSGHVAGLGEGKYGNLGLYVVCSLHL